VGLRIPPRKNLPLRNHRGGQDQNRVAAPVMKKKKKKKKKEEEEEEDIICK
jgi:hypothetical protein